MRLYGGIDLHSNNCYVALLDEEDRVVSGRRLPNDLDRIVQALAPYREQIQGLVVESTYNWYWLVDGLMDAGYRVHLANTAAIQRYKGLKYSDDDTDAAWLAHLLRLGLVPEGYIYPKETRPVRDLLRRRSQLVRYRTAQILAIETQLARTTGRRFDGNLVKRLGDQELRRLVGAPELALAIASNLEVMRCLYRQIAKIEKAVLARARLEPAFVALKTTPGIGDMPQPDNCAGDRRYRPLRRGRQLRLVLPLRRQRVAEQRQAETPRQYQERQQVAGLGLCRGGAVRGPLLAGGQALSPAEKGQDQRRRGDQGGRAQVGPGVLLRDAGRNAVRPEALLRLSGRVATASLEMGLAHNHQI